MTRRKEKLWRGIERVLWVLVAFLFHAAVVLAVVYLPAGPTLPPTSTKTGAGQEQRRLVRSPARSTQPGEQPLPPGLSDAPAAEPALADRDHATPPPLPESVGPVVSTQPAGRPSPDSENQFGPLLAMRVPPATSRPDGASPSALARLVSPGQVYANRLGAARQQAMARFGGTAQASRAVADALAWLAAHQDANGRWDRAGFASRCPAHDRCPGAATSRLDRSGDLAVSALALLAFLGDGHLPTDSLDLYRDTTTRAVDYLLAQQQENGQFGVTDVVVRFQPDKSQPVARKDPLAMYNHAIATLALAECFALTGERKLIEPVMAGVEFLARAQQPEGGWDYWPHVTHRNDTSVTGWCVQALKAAASAGLPVPVETLYRAAGHFARATEPDGTVWYADRGTGVRFDRQTGLPSFRYGPAMVAVGMSNRQMLGYRRGNPTAAAAANLLLADPPSLPRLRGGDASGLHSEYYWYYAAMAMFQHGGDHWAHFNPLMQQALLAGQDRTMLPDGRRAHRHGSWPACGPGWGENWGSVGGRVYATALMALTLEVYWRFAPADDLPADFDYAPIVERIIAAGKLTDQLALVGWLGQLRPQAAEPMLYRLLRLDNRHVRFQAAMQLAGFASPLARPALQGLMDSLGPTDRLLAEQALSRLGNVPLPDLFGPVQQVDARAGLVQFATGDSHVGFGLPVAALDDAGQPVVRMSVVWCDRATRTAIARMSRDDKDSWPKVAPGQPVRLLWK